MVPCFAAAGPSCSGDASTSASAARDEELTELARKRKAAAEYIADDVSF